MKPRTCIVVGRGMRRVGRWIVDVLVIGALVGAIFAGDTSPLFPFAGAIAIGAAALCSGTRRLTSGALVRWLLVLALAAVSLHDATLLSRDLGRSHAAIFYVVFRLAPCALLTLATLAAARSPVHLALAGGLAMGAATVLDPCVLLLGIGVLASTLMQVGIREWPPLRSALTSSCAALLAARCTTALGYELACFLAPRDWGVSHWSFGLEPSWWLVLKSSLELGTIAASVGVMRGRTGGVLALMIVAPALAWVADRSRAPFWSSGCLTHPHPFAQLGGLIAIPALVVVLVWSAPLLRALRAPT